MGGTDDKNNLKKLTIKQHAEAHKKLYEQHGHWQDKIAYMSLSGQHDNKETSREIRIASNKNRWKDPVWAAKMRKTMSEAAIARTKKPGYKVNANLGFKGMKHSESHKNFMSENKKLYWTPDRKLVMSEKIKKARTEKFWNSKTIK
tara:strand:+ start:126 stop:563 length:438 start_codon:yes stop_codon:yes gene_type:complete